MTTKLLSADDFRDAAKDGGQPDGVVFRFSTAQPETVGDAALRTKHFVFSDATVDHANDSIDPKGWDLSVFKSNPVALFSHMSWEPPIGRASNVKVVDGKLVGDIEFASAEVYPLADTIYRLVDGGFMKAVSVGFKPKEWAFTSDKSRPMGINFTKQQLLEISVCAIPANPSCLIEARSFGIDTAPLREWAEKVLDTGDTVFLPRDELAALRTQSGAVEKRYYLQLMDHVTPAKAQAARDAVKNWQNDPTDVLVLPVGMTLRTLGDEPLVAEPVIEAKAGRRVSAATRAKINEAIGYHGMATKCLTEAMDGEDPDDNDDDEPLGTVVVEAVDERTPEQKRIDEIKALRAALPSND
jgi:HK97 family phage prohead protease